VSAKKAAGIVFGVGLACLIGSVVAVGMASDPGVPQAPAIEMTDLPTSGLPPQTSEPSETAEPVYYASCDEARKADAAPLRRGAPGYRLALDRDRDGVACD
jgi:hypothetical protein